MNLLVVCPRAPWPPTMADSMTVERMIRFLALDREQERACDPELEAHGSLRFRYFSSGLYAQQLRSYFRYFERDRFQLLFQEDLRREPRAVLSRVCAFLGVKDDLELDPDEHANPAGLPRSIRIQRFLR